MFLHDDDMAGTEETRRAVARAVKAERLRIKYSVEAAASSGKLSHMTWRRVEKGEPVQDRSYSGIDKALYVPAGTTLLAAQGELDLAQLFRAIDDQNVIVKVLERDRRILTDQVAEDPADAALAERLAEVNRQLSEAQDVYARMTGRTPWTIKSARKALAGGPLDATLTTANVGDPEPALPTKPLSDHRHSPTPDGGRDLGASLVERIADLGLDELYRLRDMTDAVIAVQEQDPSKRNVLHASQAFDEAFRRIDTILTQLGKVRELKGDRQEFTEIERLVQNVKLHIVSVSDRHPELTEVQEMASRVIDHLKAIEDHSHHHQPDNGGSDGER